MQRTPVEHGLLREGPVSELFIGLLLAPCCRTSSYTGSVIDLLFSSIDSSIPTRRYRCRRIAFFFRNGLLLVLTGGRSGGTTLAASSASSRCLRLLNTSKTVPIHDSSTLLLIGPTGGSGVLLDEAPVPVPCFVGGGKEDAAF